MGKIISPIWVVIVCLLCIIGNSQSLSARQLSALDFSCSECEFLVDAITTAATDGLNGTAIEIATYVCYALLKEEDKTVCAGVVAEFANELFQVIDAGAKLEAQLICWGFFNSCPEPPTPPTWNVTFPKPKPPYVPPVYPAKGSPSYKVLHISDIHVDHLYQVGSYVHCGEPVCCRSTSPYVGDNATAREWGEYACDGSPKMLDAGLNQATSEKSETTIVLWTGDNPPHFLWTQTQQSVLNDTLRVTQSIKDIFPKEWIIVPSIGNHESFPVNNFGPPYLQSWLYGPLADAWSSWLPSEAVSTLRKFGYFAITLPSVLVGGKTLKVISLQTNYCNNLAFWLYLNDTDPGNQLHWLIDELQESEDEGQAVWISGHIPPSTDSCMAPWANRLMQIINRYEATIAGQFYGHTHLDSFVVNFVEGRPSTVQYICPSVTTSTNINPSWRYYDIDSKTHQVIDYSQWHYNLSDIYAKGGNPVPVQFYQARAAYNLSTLFAPDWYSLVKRFATDDQLFQSYYRNFNTGYPVTPCTGNCKESMMCDCLSATQTIRKTCSTNYSPRPNLC